MPRRTPLLPHDAPRHALDHPMICLSRESESTLPVRFFHVMDAHGLSLPDVVELLSEFGFTLSALGDTARLEGLLTPSALQYIAEVFDVRLGWLEAGGERVTLQRRWTSDDLHRQLTAEYAADREPSVTIVRGAEGPEPDPYRPNVVSPHFAVVRREHCTRSGTRFATLQVWPFDRWQELDLRQEPKASRAGVEAMVAICGRTRTRLGGVELPNEALHALSLGRRLPIQVLGCLVPRTWQPRVRASRGSA